MVVVKKSQGAQYCHDSNKGEHNDQHNDEYDESGDVVLAHAVANPSAVMIVLFDAHPAGITVIASFGYSIPADKANLFDGPFAIVLQKRSNVFVFRPMLFLEQG